MVVSHGRGGFTGFSTQLGSDANKVSFGTNYLNFEILYIPTKLLKTGFGGTQAEYCLLFTTLSVRAGLYCGGGLDPQF